MIDLRPILKAIRVQNFKSLKNLNVTLKSFNVIVGKNASGKTNFIELFKFLKNALIYERRPYVPFIEWWNYRNIVWKNDETLPIIIGFNCDCEDFNIDYEVVFSLISGSFTILSEKLIIDNILNITREGQIIKINHDEKFLLKHTKNKKSFLNMYKDAFPIYRRETEKKEFTWEEVLNQTIEIPADFSNLINYNFRPFWGRVAERNLNIMTYFISEPKNNFRIILPRIKEEETFRPHNIFNELKDAISSITILKHPSIKEVKSPKKPRREDILLEDSTNLNSILYYWFLEKSGKLPDRIESALLELFPNVQIRPILTDEGNVYIKMYEDGVELDPPSMPDGLFKILSILSAIETNPAVLAIDEIENSLYAEALEYIIDELKSSETTVIITTHSPLVVDIINLDELFIIEKSIEGTIFNQIKNPDEVKEKLRKLKLTQSESWIYGELIA